MQANPQLAQTNTVVYDEVLRSQARYADQVAFLRGAPLVRLVPGQLGRAIDEVALAVGAVMKPAGATVD